MLEFNNTVRDLLGVPVQPGRDLGIDQESELSGFAKGGPVTTAGDSERLFAAAEQITAAALARLPALLPCKAVPATAQAQDECARQMIVQIGRRAYRRPLGTEEVDELYALYSAHRGPALGYAFPEAVGAVITAMLLSPQFLYHWELGFEAPVKDGMLVRFGPHQMASRLSYLLWASMPDEELFRAADAGELSTPEQIERQARRLLADPRAEDAVADFHFQWLDVGGLPFTQKDPSISAFTPELVQSMLAETRRFVGQLLLGPQAGGGLEALLTSPRSFVDERLAKLYGVPAVTGPELRPVMLDPGQRAGVLTQGSFLATHAAAGQSHPVRRGVEIVRRLLCTELEPPPDMDVGQVAPPAPGLTTRQRYAAHAMSPCAGCHRLTDPLGFAFEHYDAIGAYRTTDQGKPIDATGAVDLDGAEVRFQDAIELSRALARADQVRDCLTAQWLRYALGRRETASEAGSVRALEQAFAASSYDLRELLVAVTRTRPFSLRSLSPGEVLP